MKAGEGKDDLALVLSGGGAHAAYEVGFMRGLARQYPDLEIPILTGVSAGAINAVFLANHAGPFATAVGDLARLWETLTIDQVFRSDSLSLLKNLFLWQLSLVSGGLVRAPSGQGLVDSAPLRTMLQRQFGQKGEELAGIKTNLQRGRLKAVAISATDYCSDRAVTWVQGEQITAWDRPHRYGVAADLTIDHIMASAALPLFFPAVGVKGSWFGDGGMRQTSSLAPALHLGACRVLAVSTRYETSRAEDRPPGRADHPPPAQVIGTLINSIFLDLLLRDARVLERINYLLRKMPAGSQSDFREIDLFLMQPSRNIARLSGEYRHNLPKMFNYLARGWGSHKVSSPDWLSIVMFDAPYLKRMMEIGEADAAEKLQEIAGVIEG